MEQKQIYFPVNPEPPYLLKMSNRDNKLFPPQLADQRRLEKALSELTYRDPVYNQSSSLGGFGAVAVEPDMSAYIGRGKN